jgi:hypothetical protein
LVFCQESRHKKWRFISSPTTTANFVWWSVRNDNSKNVTGQCLIEDDVYNFLEYYRWEGTAFEKGINEKEQMERLLKENIELKDELGKLNREIYELECRLGIKPF